MFRSCFATWVVLVLAGASVPSAADAAVPTVLSGQRATAAPVQLAAYRYRYFRGRGGRNSGRSFTPWYLLPKTDPRRYNGPRYYYN